MKSSIELGKPYRDKHNGRRGYATARTEYWPTGQIMIRLETLYKNEFKNGQWFDESRLVADEELGTSPDSEELPPSDKTETKAKAKAKAK